MSEEPQTLSQSDLWALGVVDGLELIGQPGALVEARGQPLAVNESGRQLLGRLLDQPRRPFRFADRDSRVRFDKSLGDVLTGPIDKRVAIVIRTYAENLLALWLFSLPETVRHSFTDARVLVLIKPPAEFLQINAKVHAHNLTSGELRLVEELCTGCSLKDASSRLHVSYETARSRLKRIYAKTGTHRQGELIALLSSRIGG